MYLKSLDERQLKLRADIFKHCALLMGGMLLLNIFLKELSIAWAPGIYPELITLAAAVMVCNMEMIHHEIYQLSKARFGVMMGVLGAVGIALIALSILDMIRDGIGPLEESGLSSAGAGVVTGACYAALWAYYLVKSALRKREIREE